jgi:putative nucleotidyltransferase with HDIG domain
MDEKNLEYVRGWFAAYCQTFYTEDVEDQRNILLKEKHTHLVCANIIRIAAAEGLNQEGLLLAETIALLHDVGRFEQYRQYRTFRDSISVDHAALGAEIIREIDLLSDLSPRERDLVNDSVESHNIFTIPKKIMGEHRYFLQLVRDADKLDIWRVFTEFYEQPEAERSTVAGLGFPDRPECSPEVVDKVANGEIARLSAARTLNDFKLVQLSWVYDLTFPESFRMVAERDAIHGIAQSLPDTEGVRRAVEAVRGFVEERRLAPPVRHGEGT